MNKISGTILSATTMEIVLRREATFMELYEEFLDLESSLDG